MPVDWAGIAAAGATVASTSLQVGANSNMNRKSRRFSRQMYERQRADNLSDFHLQNAYNHPSAQVERMKEAGLNPALMYGGSGGGGVPAESIRSADAQRPEFNAPDFSGIQQGVRDSLLISADLDVKREQANQLQAATTTQYEQAKLAETQRLKLEFDLGLAGDLRETSIDAAKESLRQTKLNIDLSLRQDERAALQAAQSLKEGMERILTMQANRTLLPLEYKRLQATIRDTNLSADLKREDLKLRKEGVFPGDPLYVRYIAMRAADILRSVKDAIPDLKQKFEGTKRGFELHSRTLKNLPFIPFKY